MLATVLKFLTALLTVLPKALEAGRSWSLEREKRAKDERNRKALEAANKR